MPDTKGEFTIVLHYYSAGNEQVWIGLAKTQYHCGNKECRREGWTWADETQYRYPDWYQWYNNEPDKNEESCARLAGNGAWYGRECQYPYAYICEKGKIYSKVSMMYMQSSSFFCCFVCSY